MSDNFNREPMLDMFIFETLQLIEQLEQSILSSEKSNQFETSINEIFRIMHTIKGSAAMMMFNNISSLAHSMEDLFYFLREEKPKKVDSSKLSDIVLEGLDFIKIEVAKINDNNPPDGNPDELIDIMKDHLSHLKKINKITTPEKEEKNTSDAKVESQRYYISPESTTGAVVSNIGKKRFDALILFDEGCEMENIRAFTIVHKLKEFADEIQHYPEDIVGGDESIEIIRQEGFRVSFSTILEIETVRMSLMETIFLKELELNEVEMLQPEIKEVKREINLDEPYKEPAERKKPAETEKEGSLSTGKQTMISVNIAKLDKLMDLVGELIISEAMVTRNPELQGLQLDNFQKAARQLRKITNELQDSVMSIRMVPLSTTFQKMNRLVRDMCKKLKKEAEIELIGEETEVDKNIIENLSDPLMHLIRNSLDHGIESVDERIAKGKSDKGKITLEAKNSGSDIWIIVKDNGKGLDKEKILAKARQNGLVTKPENELTDREIFSFIFLPGFSTKEKVTEFSGRGVGMDVVTKNIEKVGGKVIVDSIPGQGSVFSIKIPLTLAIVDGMVIRVGKSKYTIPTATIKESLKVAEREVIKDPDGNEMMMIRGECYPILRLHEHFKVKTDVVKIHEGIIVMVEEGSKSLCLFADELLGEQQVVVKALPGYIKKVRGMAGCTLLGDGNISLILDIAGLVNL